MLHGTVRKNFILLIPTTFWLLQLIILSYLSVFIRVLFYAPVFGRWQTQFLRQPITVDLKSSHYMAESCSTVCSSFRYCLPNSVDKYLLYSSQNTNFFVFSIFFVSVQLFFTTVSLSLLRLPDVYCRPVPIQTHAQVALNVNTHQ